MAKTTDIRLQNQVIYSIYVRSHTDEGTFLSVIPDLDRIKALGTDIIWFMPIHPIGVEGKKGSLGCPYANKDYRTTNPAYGTMEEFEKLVEEIHQRGMKVMIDVVYNHTSPDSTLVKEHPEYFYHDKNGKLGNKLGDWSDVVDLDYENKELWEYQIESLKMWAKIVDGFRCDVASFVPLDFWKEARESVARVNPDCIWLAETVHISYGNLARRNHVYSEHDFCMYEAFDIEYEYDIREEFERYLRGEIKLSCYMNLLNFQEAMYPANYNKLRYLENHDTPRIAESIKKESDLKNYLAMMFFIKGTTLLYAGEEFADEHWPSLFEREVIHRDTGRNFSDWIATLSEIKHKKLGADDYFLAKAEDDADIAILERGNADGKKMGIFSLKSKKAEVSVEAKDGSYTNLLDGSEICVKDGKVKVNGKPMIWTMNE